MGKNLTALVIVFIVFIAMIYGWVANMKDEPMHNPHVPEAIVPPATLTPAIETAPASAPSSAPAAEAPKP